MSDVNAPATVLRRSLLSALRRSDRKVSAFTVLLVALLAAAGGAVAGCHPTGTGVLDPLYSSVFAALVTYVASRASRETLLVLAAVSVVMSRGWLYLPAIASLALAFYAVIPRHSRRRVGAVVGAVSVEVMLRWPYTEFHGFSALVAAAAIVPVSVSAYLRLSDAGKAQARRAAAWIGATAIVVCLPLLICAGLALGKISDGKQAADAALADMSEGTSASSTAELDASTSDFGQALTTLGGWWTALSRAVPGVAQQRQVVVGAIGIARDVSAVGAAEAPNFDYHELKYEQGQIDLDAISAMQRPAEALHASLLSALRRLQAVRDPWLVSPLSSALDQFTRGVGQAETSTELALQAIPIVPEMLGADAPRNYLVVFVTPAESRGLDGVVGAYADLTAQQGRVSLAQSGPVEDLNAALPAGGGTISGLTDFMTRYGEFSPGKYFQDATFSPDLPTDAQVLSQLYPQAGGAPVDGVLMVDPYGLASLLAITGPVQVPGIPVVLTNKNVAGFLLETQYLDEGIGGGVTQTTRHDYLQDALHETFQKLVNGSLPGPSTLSHDLLPAVLDGHIGLWSAHPQETPLLGDLHLEDRFPTASGGGLVALTVQNAGANKIDSYLHTSVTDAEELDSRSGAVHEALTVAFQNDAPSSGFTPIVIDSPAAPGVPPGASYFYFSVYSPYALASASLAGKPLSMSSGTELGTNVFSAWILVPSASSAQVALSFVGTTPSPDHYELHVRMPPSANPVPFRADVSWTDQTGVVDSWTAGSEVDQAHLFVRP